MKRAKGDVKNADGLSLFLPHEHSIFHRLLHAIHSVYQPNKVVLGNRGPVEPFALTLPAKEGPVVYFCTGKACQPPMKEAKAVSEAMKKN